MGASHVKAFPLTQLLSSRRSHLSPSTTISVTLFGKSHRLPSLSLVFLSHTDTLSLPIPHSFSRSLSLSPSKQVVTVRSPSSGSQQPHWQPSLAQKEPKWWTLTRWKPKHSGGGLWLAHSGAMPSRWQIFVFWRVWQWLLAQTSSSWTPWIYNGTLDSRKNARIVSTFFCAKSNKLY